MKYQIKDSEKGWITVTHAAPTSKGWLHYELKEADGGIINGIAKPGNWQIKPEKGAKNDNEFSRTRAQKDGETGSKNDD